uniref:Uncharacterized protein n=1 Tax=Heterorhabditis bacteriophora TaxID=37862 RepID=A0A1I7WXL0_HETBA
MSASMHHQSSPNGSHREQKNSMERECHSLADLANSVQVKSYG